MKFLAKRFPVCQSALEQHLRTKFPDIKFSSKQLWYNDDFPSFNSVDLPTAFEKKQHPVIQSIFVRAVQRNGDVFGFCVCRDVDRLYLDELFEGIDPTEYQKAFDKANEDIFHSKLNPFLPILCKIGFPHFIMVGEGAKTCSFSDRVIEGLHQSFMMMDDLAAVKQQLEAFRLSHRRLVLKKVTFQQPKPLGVQRSTRRRKDAIELHQMIETMNRNIEQATRLLERLK